MLPARPPRPGLAGWASGTWGSYFHGCSSGLALKCDFLLLAVRLSGQPETVVEAGHGVMAVISDIRHTRHISRLFVIDINLP